MGFAAAHSHTDPDYGLVFVYECRKVWCCIALAFSFIFLMDLVRQHFRWLKGLKHHRVESALLLMAVSFSSRHRSYIEFIYICRFYDSTVLAMASSSRSFFLNTFRTSLKCGFLFTLRKKNLVFH